MELLVLLVCDQSLKLVIGEWKGHIYRSTGGWAVQVPVSGRTSQSITTKTIAVDKKSNPESS